MDDIAIEVLHAGATTLQNLAFAWLVGWTSIAAWAGRTKWHPPIAITRGVSRSGLPAAVVLIAMQPVLLWLEAASMADVPLFRAMPAIADVVRTTHYGATWNVGLAVSAAIIALAVLIRARGATTLRGASLTTQLAIPFAIALAAFSYTRSLLGHAADHGNLGLDVILDWAHLLFISTWVGEVLVATAIVLPRLHDAPGGGSLAASFASALSRTATVALAGVLATGIVKAVQSVGSPDNLIGNPYGNALTVKLLLVAVAIGLGGFNRFFVLPLIAGRAVHESSQEPPERRRAGMKRFLTIVRIESCVLIGVMIAAAVLSASAPPMDAR